MMLFIHGIPIIMTVRDICYPPRIRNIKNGIEDFDALIEELAKISGPTNPNLVGACFQHGEAYIIDSSSTYLHCPRCLNFFRKGNERLNN
jgi:hypothetical protein